MRWWLALSSLLAGCACGVAIEREDAGTDAPIDAAVTDAVLPPDAALVSRCPHDTTRAIGVAWGGGCRLDLGGQLWCWGVNEWGLVRPGGGTHVEPVPVAYAGLDDVRALALTEEDACVVHEDGGVSCWGARDGTTEPHRMAGVAGADAIAMGDDAACAHRTDGGWTCWGTSSLFIHLVDARPPSSPPIDVPALAGASRVSVGYPVSAIVDGEVLTEYDRRGALHAVGVSDAVDVAAARGIACALRRDGSVWCWEADPEGRGHMLHRIDGLDDVVGFAQVGYAYLEMCAVRRDGTLWCWSVANSRPPEPFQVPGASDVERAAMGAQLCVSTCGGEVRCDGFGITGENGDGRERVTPHDVPGIDDAVALDGDCALRADHTVWCWDLRHTTTTGRTCVPRPDPVPVTGLDDAVALSSGCALREDGTIACIGPYYAGTQAPTLAGSYAHVPGTIVGFAHVDLELVVLSSDGSLYYWPFTFPAAPSEVPSVLPTPDTVAELVGRAMRTTHGRVYDLACDSDLEAACWVGAAWPDLEDAERLWLGSEADCVRRTGRGVWCRFHGRSDALPRALGIGSPATNELVHVPALDGAAEIVADRVLCARDATGALDCWGDPARGQLGTNDAHATHARLFDAGTDALSAGTTSCALRGGVVTCWGANRGWWSSAAVCPLPFDGL